MFSVFIMAGWMLTISHQQLFVDCPDSLNIKQHAGAAFNVPACCTAPINLVDAFLKSSVDHYNRNNRIFFLSGNRLCCLCFEYRCKKPKDQVYMFHQEMFQIFVHSAFCCLILQLTLVLRYRCTELYLDFSTIERRAILTFRACGIVDVKPAAWRTILAVSYSSGDCLERCFRQFVGILWF